MTAERWSVGAEAAGLEALGSHRSGQRARNGMVGYGRVWGVGRSRTPKPLENKEAPPFYREFCLAVLWTPCLSISGQRARNGMVGYGRSGGLGAAGHQIGLKIRRHHHVIENFVGLSRGHPTFPFLAKVPEIDR